MATERPALHGWIRLALRLVGAALLTATGGIHLDLYLTGYNTIPTIGWLFLLQIIAAFALAVAVVFSGAWQVSAAGAGFALATFGGYLLSVWVGLFGFTEVRTTAGIVAGVIEVAAFAVLAAASIAASPDAGPSALLRQSAGRLTGPIAVVSVVALALLGAAAAVGRAPARSRVRRPEDDHYRRHAGAHQRQGAHAVLVRAGQYDGVQVLRVLRGVLAAGEGAASAGPGIPGKLATIKRTDGSLQATYDGHPLYTYIADHAPGQAHGNNVNLNGGVWHEVTVSG